MNNKEKLQELTDKLKTGEPVKRFDAYRYRFELRFALRFDKEALEYLERLVDMAVESL